MLLAAAVLAAAGRPASAQQVYIRNLWVNSADRDAGSTCSGPDSRGQIICKRTSANPSPPQSPCEGNISNDPEIQYDNPVRANCAVNFGNSCGIVPNPYGATIANNIPAGSRIGNIANNRVALCSKLGWANTQSGNSTFGIDFVSFEVFKFAQGTNPLDSGSAPPLRTYFIDDPGIILAGTTSDDANGGGSTAVDPACIYWDGDINIQGEFGKSNGDYGFRATVSTNQTGASGNINISQTRAYPGSATLDYSASSITDGATTCTNSGVKGPGTTGCAGNSTSCATAPGNVVDQKPIKVDVTNIHVVRTSPTVVGDLTAVAAEPYNITYRLSKDANMTITINNASASGSGSQVRALVPNQERAGEGIPSGTLQNGDSWNGRADNGDLLLPGLYLADMIAFSNDQYGTDVSNEVFRQIALDPLQITDVRVQPLAEQSTSLAVISFVLTEPATAYLEIYPPGTQFGPVCGGAKVNPLSNLWDDCQDIDPFIAPPTGNPINSTLLGRTLLGGGNDSPQARLKDFNPTLGGLTAPLIRRIFEQKDARKSVILFWDGRDKNGNVVEDGDYVFVLYADLPSMNGCPYPSNAGSTPGVVCTGANATSFSNSQRIFATNAKSGFIPVNRGLVTVSQIGPSSTVIGSSPPVAGLDPFTFSYTLSRDATVSLKIFNTINGAPQQEVRTLVNKEQRPGAFLNRERWNFPTDNNGLVVSSGNYLVQLTAYDPFIPAKVSTTTALFPINLFRVTDVFNSPLLTGATDVVSLSYQLSQPMFVAWNIYPPGTVVHDPAGTGNPYWPPCQALIPNSTTCTQISSTTFQNQAQVGVAPIITINGMRPGRLRVSEFWDGRDANGIFVADGNYIYTLVAQSTTTPQYFATDQVVGQLTVARGSIVFPVFNVTPTLPVLFNSSQTVALAPYEISYSVTRQSSVTIQILNTNLPPSIVRTIIQGQVREANIINREFWDARNDSGTFVTAGFYNVRALASDLASALASGSTAQQTISVNPLRIYDVAISPLSGQFRNALINYQVSETMRVSLKIYRPGTIFDLAGNPSPPEDQSLVKRIVGVRAARNEISESWDGTDLRLSQVPDGNYVFRIFASTDIASIDQATGNAVPGATLASDIIIAEIPVARGGSQDPKADFAKNSFVYPNPLTGPSGQFQIYSPIQGNVSLKIYNIAGDLVLDKGFGEQAQDTYVNFTWGKTNQAGKPVAHGVYFMLIREEPTKDGGTAFQTVKKILIP